jgi:magnesium transporter
MVRGLALGRVEVGQLGRELGRQSLVGVFLGLLFGALLSLVSLLLFPDTTSGAAYQLPLVVGLAIFGQMGIAALLGSALPMVFARLKIDPAVATGPFVTTSMDLIGIVLYFNIAALVLGIRP